MTCQGHQPISTHPASLVSDAHHLTRDITNMETHRRSFVKAATYRLFAMSLVFGVALVYTGDISNAAKIGVSAAIAKTLLYYLWERLWNRISWGVQGTSASSE